MHLYTIVFVAIICLKIAQVHCNGLDNSLKIAVGSCNRHKQEGIWDIVSHHKPEKLILLGDNIYADKRKGFTIGFGMFEEANPFELSLEYARLGADQSFQDMIQEIGGLSNVYAIYDDHDFGIDNGGAHYQFKQESRDEFNKFFQVDYSQSHRETLEDGVYSSHIIETNINGVVLRIKVIMLDVRYNRVLEPSASCDFLGDKQWEWLERELDSSIYNPNAAPSRSNSSVCDAIDMRDGVCSEDHEGELEGGHVEPPVDLILLGSGIQILPQGKMIEETWDKLCVPNRERLLGMLSDTIEKSVKYNGHNDWNNHINIVLLSGDVHAAEISQVIA